MTRVLALAAGTLGLAACGGSSFADASVAEIEKQAIADMKALKSLSMDATIESGGQETGFQVSLNDAGDCEGELTLDGGRTEFLQVDDKVYFKASDEAITSIIGSDDPQALTQFKAVVGDKWLTGVPTMDFSSFCDLEDFLDELDSDDDGETTKGEVEEVDGEEAIVVTTKDGDETTKGWVATEGKHYILKIESSGDEESGTVRLSDFNEEVSVEAPADDEVFDLAQLG